MTLEELKEKFGMVRPAGRGFNVLCPAHADTEASLNIAEGEDGNLLLKCYAGCDTGDILDALDLTWSDINKTNSSEPIAIYSYTDENGKELYQRLRFHPKRFSQRHRVGDEWVWNLHGVRPTIYNLSAVLEFGGTVYITEGEKDADRLTQKGVVATTSGGVNSWRPEFAQYFLGAGKVIVVAHRDPPGMKHAKSIKESLERVGVEVSVVQAQEFAGNDASDHLDAGYQVKDFIPVQWLENEARHYQPMDLFQPVPSVDWVVENIVVGGEVTLLIGDGGSGKSYFALAMALHVADGRDFIRNKVKQGRVMYVDEEGSPDLALQRLHQLGATKEQKDNLDYLNFPKINLADDPGKLLEDIQLTKPVLVIIDSHAKVTKAREENSNNEMGRVWDEGLLPLARETKAAVLVIHHTNGFGGARGASQIRNSADQVLTMTIREDQSRLVHASKPRRMTETISFRFDKVDDRYVLSEAWR